MSTPATYLLEVGTEELPASFLETAIGELQDRTKEALKAHRLTHGEIQVLYTPRRLALFIHNLALTQPQAQEEIKGPPVSVALDANGKPTPAGLGFAKKMGVEFSQLQQQTIDGTEYIVCQRASGGKTAQELLPELLPDVVLGLSGSHFMSWDTSEIKFSRPIRWLVSLLNDSPLPIQIGLVQSQTESRSHRFLAQTETVRIPSAAQYAQTLAVQGQVQVDQAARRQLIIEGLEKKAIALNSNPTHNEALLDTVTMLVELPSIIHGSFDQAFLKLPKPVITTVMASHQKYFALEDAQGKLQPYFMTVANNALPEAEASIRHGNEKVLRARLEDANFFFQEDTKKPLSAYVEALQGITFQKGLGTLWDKTQRLKALVQALAPLCNLSSEQVQHAVKAAELCKADLATQMVRELTELQGMIGQEYALLSGESKIVSDAIEAHYHPRFLGDTVATEPVGMVLALADKLDTLLAVFSQKDARYPTGSKDPMGLRRMALGTLLTLIENQSSINLDEALRCAYKALGSIAQESEADVIERTQQFLLQRFKGYLLDQNYPYDRIDAVLEAHCSCFTNLPQTLARLEALKALQQNSEQFKRVYEPANRIAKILSKGYLPETTPADINAEHFEHPCEQALLEAYTRKPFSGSNSPQEQLAHFAQWDEAIETFFNNTLVNAEDPAVKQNRYKLLSLFHRAYIQFADFTKLVV